MLSFRSGEIYPEKLLFQSIGDNGPEFQANGYGAVSKYKWIVSRNESKKEEKGPGVT